MSLVNGIVFDCAHPAALACFCAEALGYHDTTMAEEVARLVSLGASVFREHDEDGTCWTVMLDLEGNEHSVLSPPR